MTDDFLWGGINIRKFCMMWIRNFWMIIAIMIITYLGLDLVDQQTYSSSYTSTAVAAAYPITTDYRFHTIENVSDLASKTELTNSVFNSDLFQSNLYDRYPSLKDCTIECTQIANTDLLIMHVTNEDPRKAYKGVQAALDYYSQFSENMRGASEIRIMFGPEAPYRTDEGSKIQKYKIPLCVLSGLMMVGLLLFIYVTKRTYKTEGRIRKRYENVRFFSLSSVPSIESGSKSKKRSRSQRNRQNQFKKVALEIKQVLHKCDKKTLLMTSLADKKAGTAFLSALARELAEQGKRVLLIETESWQHDDTFGPDASDDIEMNTLMDVLQQKCTLKDAMIYREELKTYCIQCGMDNYDKDFLYSAEDVRRELSHCLDYAELVLINGAANQPSYYEQIWHEAADASLILCRQEDADFFKVDKMFNAFQNSDTYFAGCVLLEF